MNSTSIAKSEAEGSAPKGIGVGSGDQRNTLWGTVELEGDRDGTYWDVRACLRPRKQTCGSDGNRGSR